LFAAAHRADLSSVEPGGLPACLAGRRETPTTVAGQWPLHATRAHNWPPAPQQQQQQVDRNEAKHGGRVGKFDEPNGVCGEQSLLAGQI